MTIVPPALLRTRLAAAALAVWLIVVPTRVWGNMAEPPEPATVHAGQVVGEPADGLREVAIEGERLHIDLRPLAEERPAVVEAVYRVRNDGERRRVDLLFVANGLTGGEGGVWLDGRPVASASRAAGTLPQGWRAPETTPAVDEVGALPYRAVREGAITFTLDLPPGQHEIRVRYPAEPSAFNTASLMPVWQLGYVLAPAREWAGFGRLDVRVDFPSGWTVAATPEMRRDGDALVGSWDGIPADALALSAQAPAPSAGLRYLGMALLSLAALLLLRPVGRALGRALARRGRSPHWALPASALLGLLWTGASLAAFGSVQELVSRAAGRFAELYYVSSLGYLMALFAGIGLFVAWPVSVLVIHRSVMRGHRAHRDREAVPAGAPSPLGTPAGPVA